MEKIKDYDKINKIIKEFNISGDIFNIKLVNTGIINSTYKVMSNSNTEYLLQKINTNVFKDPYTLMKNIESVTNFIKENDSNNDSLTIIKTKQGKSLYVYKDEFLNKSYYRMFNYISNTVSYNNVDTLEIAYNIGKGFGHFQNVLRNYPVNLLKETIPNFHNTKIRYDNLIEAYKKAVPTRKSKVYKEIHEIISKRNKCSIIVDLLDKKKIPYRVTHNDTKISNVLLDSKTKKPVAVVDLDTVMKGSCLYDYGDGIRSACSTALEDEKDLSKVSIDMEKFKAYTEGYLSEMAPCLKPLEVENMANSIKIITLELAMRFLEHYLNGDTYFRTDYDEHNLVRARNQLKLVKEIEEKMPQIKAFINECYKKYKGKAKSKRNSK